jgi:hypothetical protein
MRHPWRLPSLSTSQIHDLKMKIDPVGKIMLSKSAELLIVIVPQDPT